jgi:hypothetical protein
MWSHKVTCNRMAFAQFITTPLATYLLISSSDVDFLGRPAGATGKGTKAPIRKVVKSALRKRFT